MLNDAMIKINREFFNELLESYYFQKACEELGIEKWEKYSDMELLRRRYAVSDMVKESKELE